MSINSTEKVEPADCRVQTFDFISCYYKNARISALGANKTDVDSISNNLLPLDSRQWRSMRDNISRLDPNFHEIFIHVKSNMARVELKVHSSL